MLDFMILYTFLLAVLSLTYRSGVSSVRFQMEMFLKYLFQRYEVA
jgi:hypothetical protein